MAQPAECCSDTEDLFGDYDSLLEDSSLLGKLEDAERDERRRELQIVAVDQQDLAAPPPPEDGVQKRSCQMSSQTPSWTSWETNPSRTYLSASFSLKNRSVKV
ncbi:unnamed protein product [Pleuronectes platessa]|uniref:Uncharacterized protein n=1 Tax=Pleuronectes platessa TaxID=8262 RepID=A0A9N7U7J2_PLEPL|nr:unnamed protein product [Pleuronectes platessa]